jgi:hypothetical protein
MFGFEITKLFFGQLFISRDFMFTQQHRENIFLPCITATVRTEGLSYDGVSEDATLRRFMGSI